MTSDPLDTLYSAPLKEFVAERKRVVAALKAAGQGQQAKEVALLPKPSVSAWATNQLARRQAELVEELADVTARLRDAQLGGGKKGNDSAYGEAVARQRELLKTFRGEVEEILHASGHGTSPQVVERVIRNVREGVADPAMRDQVTRGRLATDLEARDFAALIGEGAGPSPGRSIEHGKAPAKSHPAADRAAPAKTPAKGDHDQRRAREAAAREQAAERQRAAARTAAEREVTRLQASVTATERVLEKEERAVEHARDELTAREQKLAATRAESDRLTRALKAAESALAKLD